MVVKKKKLNVQQLTGLFCVVNVDNYSPPCLLPSILSVTMSLLSHFAAILPQDVHLDRPSTDCVWQLESEPAFTEMNEMTEEKKHRKKKQKCMSLCILHWARNSRETQGNESPADSEAAAVLDQ